MTNSTNTYWAINGKSLQTYAFNITTLGGDRMAPPPIRGGNLIVPSKPGRMWMPKQIDQRVITLGMWVQGCNEDGSVPANVDQRKKFMENWSTLRELLWTPRKTVELSKRIYDANTLKTVKAEAQFSSGLLPSMTGGTRAVFTVDLTLADPYFYGDPIVNNLTNGVNNITVKGDDVTQAIKFTVTGPRRNIKIRNNTLGVQIEYRGDLSTGDKLDISVADFTSVTDPITTAPYNSIGSVRHEGDAAWFLLAPGTNNITVSSDTGVGLITMTRQEVWL